MSESPNAAELQQSADAGAAAAQQMARGGAAGQQVGPGDFGPETEIWSGRTHWLHYGGAFLLWLLINSIGIVANFSIPAIEGYRAIVALLLFIGTAIWLGYKPLLAILGLRYRLTSQRLFIERGILARTIDQTELLRVDDVRVYKSVWDRLFGLGSVGIISTDATDREILLVGVRGPDAVGEAIRQRMRKLRQKSVFVETL